MSMQRLILLSVLLIGCSKAAPNPKVNIVVTNMTLINLKGSPTNVVATNLIYYTNSLTFKSRSDLEDGFDEAWEHREPKAWRRTNVVIYWKGEYRIYRMVDWLKSGTSAQCFFTTNESTVWRCLKPYRQWEQKGRE